MKQSIASLMDAESVQILVMKEYKLKQYTVQR